MKNYRKIIILCLVLGSFTACTKQESLPDHTMEQWLENARLDAEETPQELYEKAKQEGILTIYTASTRMMDVAKSFEKQYPGLTVSVVDLRADELVGLVEKTIEAKEYACDLIFCTDVDGAMTKRLIPNQMAFRYMPKDIEPQLVNGLHPEVTSVLAEVIGITYNDRLFNAPPISNWWELTEPQWKDKVYAPNPARSVTTLATFAMMLKNEKVLEQAYLQHYGKAFTPENGESIAFAFMRKLVENGLHIVNSSDDVADAVGLPGVKEQRLGIMVSSKLRLRPIGYDLQICYDTMPLCGVVNPVNIMVAGGAKNSNSAKLFVRWVLGEADGTGEGYLPFLQEGAWSVRKDVTSQSTKKLEDMKVVYTDGNFVYENKEKILSFWEQLIAERGQ